MVAFSFSQMRMWYANLQRRHLGLQMRAPHPLLSYRARVSIQRRSAAARATVMRRLFAVSALHINQSILVSGTEKTQTLYQYTMTAIVKQYKGTYTEGEECDKSQCNRDDGLSNKISLVSSLIFPDGFGLVLQNIEVIHHGRIYNM